MREKHVVWIWMYGAKVNNKMFHFRLWWNKMEHKKKTNNFIRFSSFHFKHGKGIALTDGIQIHTNLIRKKKKNK